MLLKSSYFLSYLGCKINFLVLEFNIHSTAKQLLLFQIINIMQKKVRGGKIGGVNAKTAESI